MGLPLDPKKNRLLHPRCSRCSRRSSPKGWAPCSPCTPSPPRNVSNGVYGLGVALTASTSSFRYPQVNLGIDLLLTQTSKTFAAIQQDYKRLQDALAPLFKDINSPSNRYKMHIYRRANKGLSPLISRLEDALLSLYFDLLASIVQLSDPYTYRRALEKQSLIFRLFGFSPCAPNLPSR